MTEHNKTKSKSKVSKIYNYTVLGIYAAVLLAYVIFRLMLWILWGLHLITLSK